MKKPLAITAVALGLAAAAPFGAALAHPVSVRIDVPGVGVRIGAPVYVPAPVVVAPPPRVIYAPAPVYAPPPRVIYAPPVYRVGYGSPYPRHHHRRWDDRRGRWCD